MKKYVSGFTISELILSTVVAAICCVLAPILILSRGTKSNDIKKIDYIVKCTYEDMNCIFNANTGNIKFGKGGSENILDYTRNADEFYTIGLTGGGSGGGNTTDGNSGETKELFVSNIGNNEEISDNIFNNLSHAQTLTGYYLMQVGAGGKGANNNNEAKPGEDSVLCIISKDDAEKSPKDLSCKNYTVISVAKGGVAPVENEINTTKKHLTLFEKKTEEYGTGGKPGLDGVGGVIIIR